MTAALRRDHREERRARFRWKRWDDILGLVGTSLIVGAFVYMFLMMWSDLT